MARVKLEPLPPEAAIRSFRAKGFKIGFAWQDVWQEEHARAFTVAKAMRVDLLNDIRQAVDKALAEGQTLKQFQDNLTPTLRARGWWGKQEVTDPLTGEARLAQLGSPRRLETIFDTNLRTSYAAGRWEAIERRKKTRPFLRYVAVLDQKTRPRHRAWHGLVLLVDDPWWDTHAPANGYKCRCEEQQLSQRDLDRRGLKLGTAPKEEMVSHVNRRTGEVIKVPAGIDPGFAYNPGKERLRGLTPRPLSEPLPAMGEPAAPVALPPLPAPRETDLKPLPAGLSTEQYQAAFLSEFGATKLKPTIYQDVVGEPLVISRDLFMTAAGHVVKLDRTPSRSRHLPFLAGTIKSPDEIWAAWAELPDGRAVLRRRYIARWVSGDEQVSGLAVFETGRDGWSGVTVFPPKDGQSAEAQDAYLEKVRRGTLVYRRK